MSCINFVHWVEIYDRVKKDSPWINKGYTLNYKMERTLPLYLLTDKDIMQ